MIEYRLVEKFGADVLNLPDDLLERFLLIMEVEAKVYKYDNKQYALEKGK